MSIKYTGSTANKTPSMPHSVCNIKQYFQIDTKEPNTNENVKIAENKMWIIPVCLLGHHWTCVV